MKTKESKEKVIIPNWSWGTETPVITEDVTFEIAPSNDYGNGRHPETFSNQNEAVEFAETKKVMPDKKHEEYWNSKHEVITKVTTIREIVRIVVPSEKK